jgi:sugar phosphate isomerase/epimerase
MSNFQNIPLTHLFYEVNIPEYLRKSWLYQYAQAGLKNIVLSDSHIANIAASPVMMETYAAEASQAGLNFVDAHAPFGPYLDLGNPKKEYHNYVVSRHKLHIDIAAQFGIKTITIHLGGMKFDKFLFEEYKSSAQRALEEILPHAEKRNVIVCIENVWYPVSSLDMLLYLKDKFPTDYLGFCFDAGHANIMATKNANTLEPSRAIDAYNQINQPVPWDDEILDKMLFNIVNCHLHDNCGLQDQHQLPGHGNIDWKNVLTKLSKAPRLQVIQNEAISPGRDFIVSPNEIKAAYDKIFQLV